MTPDGGAVGATPARVAEIAANLVDVRARLERACTAAGRPLAAVRLLAVTKTFAATDVAVLLDLGCADFGEAREQEAAAKVNAVDTLRPGSQPRWTVLGRLQRNKARAVVRWAHEVQSVDSPRLLEALARGTAAALEAGERTEDLDVLLQVSLDADPERGGCPVAELAALAELAAAAEHVRLRGLMAVAPVGVDADLALAQLAAVAERIRLDHPGAVELSAGMSGDLEAGVRHGSTCVRVGTALLGSRPIISR